jgi:hypothetical protein
MFKTQKRKKLTQNFRARILIGHEYIDNVFGKMATFIVTRPYQI